MNPIVLSGAAHIASTVAAYDVGTDTSKNKPGGLVQLPPPADSPPAMISSADTEGTNST